MESEYDGAEKVKKKLDVIAASNGCTVVNYDLAYSKYTKGFWDEYISKAMYVSFGFVIGAMTVLLYAMYNAR